MVKNLPAMQGTQVRSLGREWSLEKRMASHSSILAWRIPCTEKPGRLQSMGLQRIRHDWAVYTHVEANIRFTDLCSQTCWCEKLSVSSTINDCASLQVSTAPAVCGIKPSCRLLVYWESLLSPYGPRCLQLSLQPWVLVIPLRYLPVYRLPLEQLVSNPLVYSKILSIDHAVASILGRNHLGPFGLL